MERGLEHELDFVNVALELIAEKSRDDAENDERALLLARVARLGALPQGDKQLGPEVVTL